MIAQTGAEVVAYLDVEPVRTNTARSETVFRSHLRELIRHIGAWVASAMPRVQLSLEDPASWATASSQHWQGIAQPIGSAHGARSCNHTEPQ